MCVYNPCTGCRGEDEVKEEYLEIVRQIDWPNQQDPGSVKICILIFILFFWKTVEIPDIKH